MAVSLIFAGYAISALLQKKYRYVVFSFSVDTMSLCVRQRMITEMKSKIKT